MVFGAGFQWIEPAAGAEIGERGAVGTAGFTGGIEGKMQDAARRFDRRKGARMHFVQDCRAQRMRAKPRAADVDVRGHVLRVACERNFGKTATEAGNGRTFGAV